MNRKWASYISFAILLSAQSISLAATTVMQERSAPPKSESKPGSASLTGCVDEQDGHYVLVDERTLTPIANLEADGFPTESFAKHLGHKVTVRGISNSGPSRPVFKVRTVDKISDTCAPQHR